MPIHVCEQGDCIGSLALVYGHLPKTIWEHGNNSALRTLRKNPDVLMAGDKVFVPDKVVKSVSRGSNATHKFKRKAVPSKLRVVFSVDGKPMKNKKYKIVIDGDEIDGVTGGDGKIEVPIGPAARSGYILIQGRKFPFGLGTLDPVETIRGIQARLNNMGFACGPIDGIAGPLTHAGVISFQKANGLTENGQWNDAPTRDLIKSKYGS